MGRPIGIWKRAFSGGDMFYKHRESGDISFADFTKMSGTNAISETALRYTYETVLYGFNEETGQNYNISEFISEVDNLDFRLLLELEDSFPCPKNSYIPLKGIVVKNPL